MTSQTNSSAADFASSYSFASSSPARKKPDSSPLFDDLSDGFLFNDSGSQSKPKWGSMPVYDKPVFDEEPSIPDLLNTSQSDRFDNVFSSMAASPSRLAKQNSSPFDDLIAEPKRREPEEKGSSVFDDLIPGFGRASSPQTKRPTSEQKPTNLVEDPFVDLDESASTLRQPPTGVFTDPFEELGTFNSKESVHSSAPHGGAFVDTDDSLHSLGKSHLRPGNLSGSRSPVDSSGSFHGKKDAFDDVFESQNTFSRTVPQATSPVYENKSDGIFDSSDEVWLTVSEIPLFTQPTSAPPPQRPPPPRPTRPITKKVNEPSLSSSANPSHVRSSARASANGHPEPPSDEDSDVFSTAVASAAAMKDAMDKAEAKFRHAKERKERENLKANRGREGDPVENYDSREKEARERQARLDRERLEKEAEMEKEAEQKRIEKERERLLARQAVERATREARQRAAAEAQAKAQRAAVAKATTDARERAERAAVQRANFEARERAAAGAREKAERAAAEARERANAETREKEAKLRAERAAAERAKAKQQESNDDLDSFFNSVSRPSSAPRQRTNPPDPFQDSWNKGGSYESSRASARASENLKKTSSATNIVDDLSSIFGASATQFGGFQDIEGETEERRRARLERHQRTQERAAKALAEKNDRDLQVQREQAEKNRIGETLDVEIKRWGAGKEGNLRALLSTLQYVLWPECGWQPVSLTDLITAASVKKFYRKATLCIHPDKVQQKGANLQQKYIAEKVFDMLKEAWNKFNSEELF